MDVAKNYRPISLLSILSKRLVYRELLSFCIEHNVIHNFQDGFLPGRSCTINLLHHPLDSGDARNNWLGGQGAELIMRQTT